MKGDTRYDPASRCKNDVGAPSDTRRNCVVGLIPRDISQYAKLVIEGVRFVMEKGLCSGLHANKMDGEKVSVLSPPAERFEEVT